MQASVTSDRLQVMMPQIEIEETFNAFVKDFGGELIEEIFAGSGRRPNNADYFFRDRTIVAELKCLEKNYFNDRNLGEKLTKLTNQWMKQGILRREHIKNGMFQTDALPPKCASEVFKIFMAPLEKAVKKANLQIKETKKHFGLTDAKGLLILANDGNYSQNPKLTIQMLARLLRSTYSGIDSFIYFTPNMRVTAPQLDREARVWISGRSRESANAVESEFLEEVARHWISFVNRITGDDPPLIKITDKNVIDDMSLVR